MARSKPLWELYKTRLREFFRQPARIFWVYGFPTILAVCLGLAFKSQKPESIQVDLVENAWSTPYLKLLNDYDVAARAANRPRLLLKTSQLDPAMRRLSTGKTPLVVEPVSDDKVVYHFDPTRPEGVAARGSIDDVIQESRGRVNPVGTSEVALTEPGSRYIDFLIPGLLGLNTMGGGLWGIGFLLVNFRMSKLLKSFIATPMPRRDFLLSLLGARLTFLVPDIGVILLMGTLAFGVPIRGNLVTLIFVDVIGALAFAGIGLLVGSRAETTETASGLMNLVMLPMWIFSGVFFSAERFPGWTQWFIQALPLTQLLIALRVIMLDGAGLFQFDVLRAILILTIWAVGTFFLALRIFKWT